MYFIISSDYDRLTLCTFYPASCNPGILTVYLQEEDSYDNIEAEIIALSLIRLAKLFFLVKITN